MPYISESIAWAILFSPLCSFVLLVLAMRFLASSRYTILSCYISILGIGTAFILSVLALNMTIGYETSVGWASHSWATVGDLDIRIGIMMNPLTSLMLVVVTGVSLIVQIYSHGYMKGDPGYPKYFAFMSLFSASMIGVVLARNIVQLYVFWELVGLCSYLLIGFWYNKPAAVAAAKKAFLVTRIGDVGLLIGILYLFSQKELFAVYGLNPLEIPHIYTMVSNGSLSSVAITGLALAIFAGAAGKSAQFPLHTWLPDAMEGPTPVSALIHAATMVAAGVFLVVRLFPIFEASAEAMSVVALVGAFTSLFAASMALVMFDIKRVLAYSTMSQLGYMMLAIGIGAPGVAIFHLFTHAFFKALLFLGAGNVNHATGTFDMRYMGGLRKIMPWTYWLFLLASLSLAGFPPLAGFWSKDEILSVAWGGDSVVHQIAFWAGLLGVFLTSFYIVRVLLMTFHGSYRGGVQAEIQGYDEKTLTSKEIISKKHQEHSHLGESPLVMLIPMGLLAIVALFGGYVVNPLFRIGFVPEHWFLEFMGGHAIGLNFPVLISSTFIALIGAALALVLYHTRLTFIKTVQTILRPLHKLLIRKYYLDEFYESFLISRIFRGWVVNLINWFEQAILDKTIDGTGWFSRNVGKSISILQTGQVQSYGLIALIGILCVVISFTFLGK